MERETKVKMIKELKGLIEKYNICITIAWDSSTETSYPSPYLAITENFSEADDNSEMLESFPLGFIAPSYI